MNVRGISRSALGLPGLTGSAFVLGLLASAGALCFPLGAQPAALGAQPAALGARPAALGSPLPVPPADWKIEVVAAAPDIAHPSVVACAPDGRVFVAEDPMDISSPSARLALGRIVCIHPDGRRTVFAEKLHAVFGMQYLEGKLYVLHNPRFSVFTDDHGVGTSRVDLIRSTHPEPWALDWNDHVPANFRLAMDGYFYVAVGDKGLYECVGTDGRRVDLRGGGIVRLRPDGSGLEIYASGVRNILDVALTSDDELFTYDNTDEQKWMSRLTHMVDGGAYGYPYDFIPRRAYTLWMMADYGPGAATGALAYTEDALRAEYHDNLFLADFGKRQILRVTIEREGGTFRVARPIELFSKVPDEFRPVGIAFDDVGRSLYICDWQHRDTKENVRVGRLLKLSYTGKVHSSPRPAWYLPAAMGRPFDASPEELIAALDHPSRNVRQTAQRRLAERGASVVQRLTKLLANPRASPRGRSHALWALDAIDGGRRARSTILDVAAGEDSRIARQALRQIGMRRVADAAPIVLRRLRDADATVRFAAATAAGRIGDVAAVEPLLAALAEKDGFVRFAVFTALNRIGRKNADSWPAIAGGLASDDAFIREGVSFALRETYEPRLAGALIEKANDTRQPLHARQKAIELLTTIHRAYPPWNGQWWAYHPVNSPPPTKSHDWESTPTILAALRGLLDDSVPLIRGAAVASVETTRDPAAVARLRELLVGDSARELRPEIVRILGRLKDAPSAEIIAALIDDPASEQSLAVAAIVAAGRVQTPATERAVLAFLGRATDEQRLIPAIEAVGTSASPKAIEPLSELTRHRSPRVRGAAVEAIAAVKDHRVGEILVARIDDDAIDVQRIAIAALGRRRERAAVPALLTAYQRPEINSDVMTAIADIPDPRAAGIYVDILNGKNAPLRERALRALGKVADESLAPLEKQVKRMTPEALAAIQGAYASHARAKNGPLFATRSAPAKIDDYARFAHEHRGDARRGRALFADPKGLACMKCHANTQVQATGAGALSAGPDLTTVGKQFPRDAIIESVLYPSKAIREGYQQFSVALDDGTVLSGLVQGETETTLVLVDRDAKRHEIAKDQIIERKPSTLSMMPENLHVGLSLAEFTDLIAFLESCRELPK